MVPSKEPMVAPVTVFFKRATVKLPVAPTNRPVPPVIVAVSTMERTFGGVNVACPLMVPNTVSPLAAVNRKIPLPILVLVLIVASSVYVNSPRWVAFPVASTVTATNALGSSTATTTVVVSYKVLIPVLIR